MILSDLRDDPVNKAMKDESMCCVCLGQRQPCQYVESETVMSNRAGDSTDLGQQVGDGIVERIVWKRVAIGV